MGGFGIKELVVILIIVALIFGTRKLRSMGSDLGGAVKGFKKAVVDENEPEKIEEPETPVGDVKQEQPAENSEQK